MKGLLREWGGPQAAEGGGEGYMGLVIRFPDVWRNAGMIVGNNGQSESATVVILPVVRIERQPEKSGGAEPGAAPSRRRRRPTSRR
jgi:hypothetical protein